MIENIIIVLDYILKALLVLSVVGVCILAVQDIVSDIKELKEEYKKRKTKK